VPTPGGSGGSEAMLAILFSTIAAKGDLAAIVLVWRGLAFYFPTIIGGFITAKILLHPFHSTS
jgi:uncharacterized membrane protein YbhN (UPF0104 family)